MKTFRFSLVLFAFCFLALDLAHGQEARPVSAGEQGKVVKGKKDRKKPKRGGGEIRGGAAFRNKQLQELSKFRWSILRKDPAEKMKLAKVFFEKQHEERMEFFKQKHQAHLALMKEKLETTAAMKDAEREEFLKFYEQNFEDSLAALQKKHQDFLGSIEEYYNKLTEQEKTHFIIVIDKENFHAQQEWLQERKVLAEEWRKVYSFIQAKKIAAKNASQPSPTPKVDNKSKESSSE